jgi:hypothetical protein
MDAAWLEDIIDKSVAVGLKTYDAEVSSRGFEPEELAAESYVYAEQKAHIEGCIRAFGLGRLLELLSTYSVVDVEREELMPLGDHHFVTNTERQQNDERPFVEDEGIIFQSRADALLRKRDTGGLYVFSFKTAGQWGPIDEQRARYDMQGLSELAAIEHRYAAEGTPEKVVGIHMDYIITGSRRKDSIDNIKKQDTYLIRPWRKAGVTSDKDVYAWKYNYQDSFGNNRRLGGDFKRVNIWEHLSMKEWVGMLYRCEVQPELTETALGMYGDWQHPGLFAVPVPYQRNERDVTDFIEQVTAQEERIVANNRILEQHKDNEAMTRSLMNQFYSQTRQSCVNFGHDCAYVPLCWNDQKVEDPDSDSDYVWRTPHHEQELIQIQKHFPNFSDDPKVHKILQEVSDRSGVTTAVGNEDGLREQLERSLESLKK